MKISHNETIEDQRKNNVSLFLLFMKGDGKCAN